MVSLTEIFGSVVGSIEIGGAGCEKDAYAGGKTYCLHTTMTQMLGQGVAVSLAFVRDGMFEGFRETET